MNVRFQWNECRNLSLTCPNRVYPGQYFDSSTFQVEFCSSFFPRLIYHRLGRAGARTGFQVASAHYEPNQLYSTPKQFLTTNETL
jgi:hypothetical protein